MTEYAHLVKNIHYGNILRQPHEEPGYNIVSFFQKSLVVCKQEGYVLPDEKKRSLSTPGGKEFYLNRVL